MDNKLLDDLLERAREKRPNWAAVRVRIRQSERGLIYGRKLHHLSNSELGLCLEILDRDRIIVKLSKPKKVAKKKA